MTGCFHIQSKDESRHLSLAAKNRTEHLSLAAKDTKDNIVLSVEDESGHLFLKAGKISAHLILSCALICTIGAQGYLEISPDVMWVSHDKITELLIKSNVDWVIT